MKNARSLFTAKNSFSRFIIGKISILQISLIVFQIDSIAKKSRKYIFTKIYRNLQIKSN